MAKAQRMRHLLLRSNAQNKAYVDFTSDSIGCLLVDYYTAHGTPNERMLTHYIKGCAYRDMGDQPAALRCYNDAVAAAATSAECEEAKIVFEKALSWSKAVNASIVKLPEELKVPYNGAKEGLAAAHTFADVAMVSSANRDAVEEEWGKFGLLEHTDIVLAQDVGSKAACIAEMLRFGYDLEKVVMVGDAPGDCDAAEKNGVWYYPILVNKEKASWDEAIAVAFGKLQNGKYAEYEAQKKKEFLVNLGG